MLPALLQFAVVTANASAALRSAKPNVFWCGWRNIMSEPNFCHLRFSSLHNTYVGVKPKQAGVLGLGELRVEPLVSPPSR
jgi:hypothetical protein